MHDGIIPKNPMDELEQNKKEAEQKAQSNKISPLSSVTIAISHLSISEFEESPKWVRTMFGGETIADSTSVMILRRTDRLPVYCFPKEDVRMDLMQKTKRTLEFPPQGTATYWSLKVGSKIAENAAFSFDSPTDAWQPLKDYVIFEWGEMDSWYEEDEEVFVHLKDPYHRIDVLKSTRHVRIVVGEQTVAETDRAMFLFETGFPTRYYIEREDVHMDFLEPSDLMTRCPYKGIASSYWRVKVGDKILENSVWSYHDPLPEVYKIKDRLCFYNEKVDAIYVDKELVPKPNTPWS